MKVLFAILGLLIVGFEINAQNQLDVDGQVKIRGNIDISFPNDNTSVHIGRNAGVNTQALSQNFSTFMGTSAGMNNTTGNSNSFFGQSSGLNNSTGNSNSFFGANTGSNNTTGCCNTFLGIFSGAVNSSGSSNVFLGQSAGFANTTGNRNTYIGTSSDQLTSGDSLERAVAIGFNAKVDCSNCLVLGGTEEDLVNVGIGIPRPNEALSFNNIIGTKINLFDDQLGIYGFGMAPAELQIGTYDNTKHISFGHYSGSNKNFVEWMQLDDSTQPLKMISGAHVTNGGVWTNASSGELKENICDLTAEEAFATIVGLNPVKFNYKLQKGEEYIGFIAENVPDLVATGDRKSLSPMDITAVLTKVVQEQQQKIDVLEAQLSELASLRQEMGELKRLVKILENHRE